MSFSSEVREELTKDSPKSLHCRIAMLAGIVTLDGKRKEEDGKTFLSIRMEQDELVEAAKRLFIQIFGFTEEDMVIIPRSSGGARLRIEDADDLNRVIQTLKLSVHKDAEDQQNRTEDRYDVDEIVFSRLCCRSAYLKGAFLAAGSVSNPEASYQLEIVSGRETVTRQLMKIIEGFGLSAKTTERRGQDVIYMKDAELISELLGQIGAGSAMMELENVRILKGIRNNVNREVNCDTANIAKITKAAQNSLQDIRVIEERQGLGSLPAELCEIAILRRDNPELSLTELGELLTPPLGKSGVNHRLRKLREIAGRYPADPV